MTILAKRKSTIATLVYDGTTWYARIFAWKQKKWSCISELSQNAESANSIPRQLLDFVKTNRVKRVRILRPAEIHQIEMELPDDLEPDEIQQAVAAYIENESGVESGSVRYAFAKTNLYQLGGNKNSILSASFDNELLEDYKNQCAEISLSFDGIGSIELAALACQARIESNTKFLMIFENKSLFVCPESSVSHYHFQTFTFGASYESDAQRDLDKIDRASRIFKRSNMPTHIWMTTPLSEHRKKLLQDAFDSDASIQYLNFSDLVTQVAMHASWHNNHGLLNAGCALVDTPKKQTSPYRAGTWLMLFILLFSATGMLLIYNNNKSALEYKQQKIKAWEKRVQKRKKLASRIESLKKIQLKNQALAKAYKVPSVKSVVLEMLDILQTEIPDYSRITLIEQTQADEYRIHGKTYLEKDLFKFARLADNKLAKLGYTFVAQIKPAQKESSRNVKEFVVTISKNGSAR